MALIRLLTESTIVAIRLCLTRSFLSSLIGVKNSLLILFAYSKKNTQLPDKAIDDAIA